MEEILASIRKILNEDDHPIDPAPEPGEASPDEVLVLDETMMVATPVPEPPKALAPDMAPMVPSPRSLPPPEAAAPLQSVQPVVPEAPASGLLAPESAAAAASSLGSLVRTLSAGRGTQVYAGGPTLEDMVRGEMRPLVKSWLDAHLAQVVDATVRAEVREQLKTWLDVHLAPLVERLVRAEIERVVGRGMP